MFLGTEQGKAYGMQHQTTYAGIFIYYASVDPTKEQ